jgi:homocysteine S-methyltransferase
MEETSYVVALAVSIAPAYHRRVNDPLRRLVEEKGFALLDGALATELERRGADLHDALWSAKLLVEAPERIENVHYDYFLAGADVGTSASYQATFEGFAARGLSAADSERLLRLSVELVRGARDRFWSEPSNRIGRRRPPLVAASVGCYGASLHDGSEYRGDYGLSRRALVEFHRPRLEILADSGADLLAFETIPSMLEAEALVELLEERAGFPAAWISFSCRNEREVSHGELFSECARVASSAESVVAVGVNCTAPRWIAGLLESARAVTAKLLVAYPNSGEGWDAPRQTWTPGVSSEPIEVLVEDWYRLGARVLGGCCRTTPEIIRGVRRKLEQVVAKDAPDGP